MRLGIYGLLLTLAASGLPATPEAKPLRAALWPKGVSIPVLSSVGENFEVVGGSPSEERKIVGITFIQDGARRICSGLYISAQRILTAAHCTCDASDFRVSNANFALSNWRPASFVSRFGGYDCNTGPANGNDLALLSIERPLAQDATRMVCANYSLLTNIRLLGTFVQNPPRSVSVGGYGYEGDNPNSWGTRRSAVVSNNSFVCAQPVFRSLGCSMLSEFVMGVGNSDGRVKDTCSGDSGGPAYLNLAGQFVPIGLVSRGLPIPQQFSEVGACGRGGIYVHLGRRDVMEWLRQNGVPAGSPTCSVNR